jgi:hypothetical protein
MSSNGCATCGVTVRSRTAATKLASSQALSMPMVLPGGGLAACNHPGLALGGPGRSPRAEVRDQTVSVVDQGVA